MVALHSFNFPSHSYISMLVFLVVEVMNLSELTLFFNVVVAIFFPEVLNDCFQMTVFDS